VSELRLFSAALNARDQEDPRINPQGTPGWAVVLLRDPWKITFADEV